MGFPGSDSPGPPFEAYLSRGAVSKALYLRQHSVNQPQSPAIRPEDLSVTPWFTTTANTTTTTIDDSITDSTQCLDRILEASSYPSSASFSRNNFSSLPQGSRPELVSTRGSSIDSDNPPTRSSAPRKAYMDLNDAIALLDETCPNPDASPSLTPRTPRTPLNANSRNKRARSKSSDNSSNYSNERLSDRSSTTDGYKEKRRPFLQKIGISKTEDRPFLSKITPRIIGKPYLEKIGPSKALERPFLDKIGSSKTLDKFNFESLRELPRAMIRRTQTIVEPSIERTREEPCKDVILVVEEEEIIEEEVNHSQSIDRTRPKGKSLLLKMYSFETEDLDERSSIDEHIIDETGPRSLPQFEENNQPDDQNSQELQKNLIGTGAELVKCRVTTSDEIVSGGGHLGSPRAASSWGNSPLSSGRKIYKPSPSLSRLLDRNYSSREMSISDEEAALIVPNSPTKRRISKVSPEPQLLERVVPSKGKNSSLPRDLDASPTKTRRQASEDILPESLGSNGVNDPEFGSFDDKTRSAELIASKSRRQTFNEAIEKFGGRSSEYRTTKRQISEDILDKTDKKDCFGQLVNERRGISSDNLIYSRETVVGSAPSASSLGYQSGSDSPFANSHPSSNNSQDMLRGTFKLLQDKFELQDVPAESYAAFKRRTRMINTTSSAIITTDFPIATERYKFVAKETTIGPVVQIGKVYDITSNKVSKVGNKVKEVSSNKDKDKDDDKDNKDSFSSSNTVKSVLKKQERIDSTNDREADVAGSLIRRPVRRILHEPSQETMDLLTELKRIKSLLKTPSEEGKDWELDCLKPARLPKKISLSDKEFCLSVERENSIRRSSILNRIAKGKKEKKDDDDDNDNDGNDDDGKNKGELCFGMPKSESGPALFEKRCLSLDYADDAKPIKPEVRAISLASERTDEKDEGNYIDSSDPGNLICECDCDLNLDVFETVMTENSKPAAEKLQGNNCLEVDIAIPVDQSGSVSPKRREKIQGRTSDLYEIISPRSTPFRVKKRLGRISVEDGVKPESFTIDKVDCRSVVTQKKTKCFPL